MDYVIEQLDANPELIQPFPTERPPKSNEVDSMSISDGEEGTESAKYLGDFDMEPPTEMEVYLEAQQPLLPSKQMIYQVDDTFTTSFAPASDVNRQSSGRFFNRQPSSSSNHANEAVSKSLMHNFNNSLLKSMVRATPEDPNLIGMNTAWEEKAVQRYAMLQHVVNQHNCQPPQLDLLLARSPRSENSLIAYEQQIDAVCVILYSRKLWRLFLHIGCCIRFNQDKFCPAFRGRREK
ncbi:hypothetical protein Ciccas_007596 [Cichlidogyrus casuarinus]|uniref:Uncharacterized protein n=1 Tax=Cichlidogyrus casuarinus TaxID=1844966 RepID=A0ABD2Q2F6_9PLAT